MRLTILEDFLSLLRFPSFYKDERWGLEDFHGVAGGHWPLGPMVSFQTFGLENPLGPEVLQGKGFSRSPFSPLSGGNPFGPTGLTRVNIYPY